MKGRRADTGGSFDRAVRSEPLARRPLPVSSCWEYKDGVLIGRNRHISNVGHASEKGLWPAPFLSKGWACPLFRQ